MADTHLYPQWDVPSHIGAVSTTRLGGASAAPYDDGSGGGGLNLGSHVGDDSTAVEQNRVVLQDLIRVKPLWLSQIHSSKVVDAASTADGAQADASFTTTRGVACAVLTADCLPVLFCDAAGGVVGAAHAGWRGLAGGVLENTVAAMQLAGAGNIQAWLGPAIGPTRFEVGEDVFAAFVDAQSQARHAFIPVDGHPGKYLADIYALARLRLQSVGVSRIDGGNFCTVSDQRFYSYRRDKVTGRMVSLIWIR